MVLWDPMHTWHLGVGRQLMAIAIKSYARLRFPGLVWFPNDKYIVCRAAGLLLYATTRILAGMTQQKRLDGCYREFRQFCSKKKIYPSIDKFCVLPRSKSNS